MIKETTLNEIFVAGKGDWARLLWEESTGRVIILSDYGNWSYCWSHRGNESVREFLPQLEYEYMGKKMLGSALYVHSDKSTAQAIRETILRARRDCSLSRVDARVEWDFVKRYERGEIDFKEWVDGTDLGDDSYELSRREVCSDWKSFWERLWLPLIKPLLIGTEVAA